MLRMSRTSRLAARPVAVAAMTCAVLATGAGSAFAETYVLRDSSPNLVTDQAGLCSMNRYEIEGYNGASHEYAQGQATISGGTSCWVFIRQSKDGGATYTQSDLVWVPANGSASTPVYYDGPGYWDQVCVKTLRNTWCDGWY